MAGFTLGQSSGATLGQSTGGLLGTSVPDAPSGVSATVDAEDQVSLSWTDNAAQEDNFRIQINRNGAGWNDIVSNSTSATPGPDTESVTIQPGSHGGGARNVDREVGTDSSMRFRVRAENSVGDSDWAYSGTVYSTPRPPENVSVNRPDNENLELTWSNTSNIHDHVEIEYRRDDSSGWISWQTSGMSGATGTSASTNLTHDNRFQYRLRTVGPSGGTSVWRYHDWGNNNNVYFTDDFESADTSAWDTVAIGSSPGGVVSTLDGDFSDTSPYEGSYALQLTEDDLVTKNLGDLSGETNVLLKFAFQTASNDGSNEYGEIEWYDGGAWNSLDTWSWGYDRTGWHEYTVLVPDSMLASDNRVRFSHNTGGASDWVAYDSVVVSDILDEWVKPHAPSSLSLDTSTENEITVTWTNETGFSGTEDGAEIDDRTEAEDVSAGQVHSSGTVGPTTETFTHSGLEDGEEYQVRVTSRFAQYRHGTFQTRYTTTSSATTVTLLPAPTLDSVGAPNERELTADWTDNSDQENGFKAFYGVSEAWEDDTFSTWNTGNWNQVTDRVYEGDYAGHYKHDGSSSILTFGSKDIEPGGSQIDYFEFIWQETNYSHGGGIQLLDSNGNEVIGVATDNPEWSIKDANGFREVDSADGYDRWVKFTIEFDWANGTCAVHFEDFNIGHVYEESGIPLVNATDVETVEIRNQNAESWDASSQFEMWVDSINFGTTHDLSANTTSDNFTNARHGDRYLISVESYTEDVRSRSEYLPVVSTLPGPSAIDLNPIVVGTVEIDWTRNDTHFSGEHQIYRSTDSGTLGTQVASGLAVNDTYHEDTSVSSETTYYYTIRRETEHTYSDTSARTTSAPELSGETTTMRWAFNGDWWEAEKVDNITWNGSVQAYDPDNLYLGLDPEEWPSLIGYYIFDEQGSDMTQITDYSGKDNHATLKYWDSTNQVEVEGDKIGKYQDGMNESGHWRFNTTDKQWVDPGDLGFHGDPAFTVHVDIAPEAVDENFGLFKFGRVDSGECFSFQGQSDGDGFTYGVLDTEETNVQVESSGDYWGEAVSVSVVYDPEEGVKKMWYQSDKVDETPIEPVDLVDTEYHIGGYPWGPDESYAGHTHWGSHYYYTCAIFDRALSESEMGELHDMPYNGNLYTGNRRLR